MVILRLRWLETVRTSEVDQRQVSRDTLRLVAFSDGVFAISITLLVLELRPPDT